MQDEQHLAKVKNMEAYVIFSGVARETSLWRQAFKQRPEGQEGASLLKSQMSHFWGEGGQGPFLAGKAGCRVHMLAPLQGCKAVGIALQPP